MFQIESIRDTYLSIYPQIIKLPATIIVISGVTGVGKTTTCEQIFDSNPEFHIMRTFTTREPRNQLDHNYYIFGNDNQFFKYKRSKDVFCYCNWRINQHKYALLKSEITRFDRRDVVLYAFDYFGSVLKAQNPDAIFNIWLICEDKTKLEQRLNERSTETTAEIERRYQLAIREQNFVLKHKETLVTQRKIDFIVDTGHISPEQVAQIIISNLQHILDSPEKMRPFFQGSNP